MANSLDFRVKNGLVVATTATIQSSTNSTSSLTGALIVVGGTGIGRDLYVGGTIYGAHTGVSTTATNVAGGIAGYIPIQSAIGVTSFISTGSVGQLLQMQAGNTATWVSTGSLLAGIATSSTNIIGGIAGSIHIQSAPGVTTFINTGPIGSVLQMQAGNTSSFVSTSSLQVGYANTATTSTFAAQLNTILQTTNASYYPTFVDSNNASASAELHYTTSTFIINPSTGQVGINTTFLSTSSKLVVAGRVESITDPAGEGGQFTMRSPGYGYRWSIDNYYGAMRIIREDDVTEASGLTIVTITSGTSNVFVVGGTAGYAGEKFAVNGGAYINGTLTATNFVGTFSGTILGTASTASQVNTILQPNTGTYYPTFVDSNNATAIGENVYTTSSFYFNPANGSLNAGGTVTGAINGTNGIAFLAGNGAYNNIALGMQATSGPANMAIRDLSTVSSIIYFDSSVNASSGGQFTFRASSGYNTLLNITTATVSTPLVTNATSTSTGALTVAGGVGIGRDMWIGGTATHLSTLASTGSVSQNALYVVGGVGIGSSLLVTGPAVFLNNVTFSGTSTYVYSTNTVYTDNLINIHVPVGSTGSNHSWSVDDGKDIGFIYHYYKGVDKDAFLGLANDSGYLEWYSNGSEVGGIFTGTEYGIFKTGGVVLTNNTSTYSTNTGALTVAGGVGIGGGLYVGGTITATNFVGTFAGTVSGTASTASQVNTILQTSDTSYYPTFVDSNNASATGELVYTTSSFSINARTGQLTVPSLIVTTNTNGLNIRIGDDVWIGDVDQANTFRVTGQQAGTSGYIIFGNSNTLSLGRAGTGPLTYGGDFTVNGTTAASSTATGALQIKGGAGIGGDLYAANIYTNGTRTIPLSIQEFTATAGQTTFTVAGGYTVGTVQVFANGVNLGSGDITASNGTTVVLTEARRVNDIIRVISGGSSTAVNNIQSFSIAMSVAMAM